MDELPEIVEMMNIHKERVEVDVLKRDQEYVEKYYSNIKQPLSGLVSNQSILHLVGPSGPIQIPCISIDSIPGLTRDFKANLVPHRTNGDYHLDLIVHTTTESKDAFSKIYRTSGAATEVEFGYQTLADIKEKLLAENKEMIDITTEPVSSGDSYKLRKALKDKKIEKTRENHGNLYLYYDPDFVKGSAFVIHIPQDPYTSLPILKKLFNTLSKVQEPSN